VFSEYLFRLLMERMLRLEPLPSASMIEERERHQIVDHFASRLEPRDNAGGWM
jgi:hypothetical protein